MSKVLLATLVLNVDALDRQSAEGGVGVILESMQTVIDDNYGETGKSLKVVLVFQYITQTTLAGNSGESCLFLTTVTMASSVSSRWRNQG